MNSIFFVMIYFIIIDTLIISCFVQILFICYDLVYHYRYFNYNLFVLIYKNLNKTSGQTWC
jgi:hypothetical protein